MEEPQLLHAQAAYILKCQLPSGAFRLSPKSDVINPYFTNLALVPLVRLGETAAVKRWMDWFVNHLTPQGFINDHRLSQGLETDTGKADSEDSYVTTFFTLVREYMAVTGDTTCLKSLYPALRQMFYALLTIQQADGLTWAKNSYRVKYLMDNCEVLRGLEDATALFTLAEDLDTATLSAELAVKCRNGILGMYDSRKKCFAMYDRVYPKWTKWYPDATSQAFPILYDVVSPTDPRAQSLYQQITARFPRFDMFQTGDFYPWMSLGYCAYLMGDHQRAKRMLDMAATVYIYGPRLKYWLIHETGWFMLTYMKVHGL
ncbi:hypothetical protein [Brevibacillus dissolubilis]|uniref:hypothetical protein n=1 Tax=Brevibacillus dissolubilis TaxID=1844116 RepID=UPI0011173472|nr:hypothetical protein [Brevibacillus dissolubilis]